MRRRILMRRHSAYLLHCIRFFYGAMLLNLVAIAFFHHKSVLAQVISMSGLWGKFLLLGMAGSAVLLIIETLAGWLWDVINSHQLRQFYEQNSKLCRHVQTIRTDIKFVCAWINRRRHWFYLPPALACLYVIPMSYWLGITEAAPVRWFYLCLSLAGIGFAILEGLISNDKARYA